LESLANPRDMLAPPLQEQSARSEGLASCARRAEEARATLARVQESAAAEQVRWIEVFSHAAQLRITPLSSAELFRRQLADHPRAWIFTSATLAVGGNFGHFQRELGLEESEARAWPSPFDYAAQALLYLPRRLPGDPNDPA